MVKVAKKRSRSQERQVSERNVKHFRELFEETRSSITTKYVKALKMETWKKQGKPSKRFLNAERGPASHSYTTFKKNKKGRISILKF